MIGLLGQSRDFYIWPTAASVAARQIDHVYFALLGLTAFFVILIGAMALGFGLKYRAAVPSNRDHPVHRLAAAETTMILAPLVISLVIFVWGARVFVEAGTPPTDARTIHVVGKQWMWKIHHPGGRQEINELHVPTGEPIRLVLTSQDVIHSFYVPAFRVKKDALPGTYTALWFNATEPGEYHLFCAEYCGADHARMRGRVVVMKPADFQQWLAAAPTPVRPNPAQASSQRAVEATLPTSGVDAGPAGVFQRFNCAACHTRVTTQAGPSLAHLFGRTIRLADGRRVVADEDYIRRAVLLPNADLPAGYTAPSPMPSYSGQVDAEQMIALIEYIKTLGSVEKSGAQAALPRPATDHRNGS